MKMNALVLACLLLSVWTVHGKHLACGDKSGQMELEAFQDEGMGKLPGLCWVCKWALKKVKKSVGPNATAEAITTKVSTVCDKIGFLKDECRAFVKRNFGELIEELSTTDNVKTVCINIKACKENGLQDLCCP